MRELSAHSRRYLEEIYKPKEGPTDGEAILGYLVSGHWRQGSTLVQSEDFIEANERRLFDAMVKLTEEDPGMEPDFVSLASALRTDPWWSAVRLVELAERAPVAQNMAYFAKRLKQVRTAVQIIESTVVLMSALKVHGDPSSALQRHLTDMTTLVTQSPNGRNEIVWLKDAVENALTVLEQRIGGEGITRILTGWEKLDRDLPLARQDMVVIGGRPGMGKTSSVLNLILNMMRTDRQIVGLIVSLEMSTDQLIFKMLGSTGSVETKQFRNPADMSSEDMDRTVQAARELHEIAGERLAFSEKKKFRVDDLATEISRIRLERGRCDFVMIDYIGLLGADGSGKDLYHKMTQVSGKLKQIARSEDVLMLCLSQLNRKAGMEKRQPEMTDLRDSGSIEQDADSIIFIHHDGYYGSENSKPLPGMPVQPYTDGLTHFLVRKNRHGEKQRFDVSFAYYAPIGKLVPVVEGY